MITPWEKEYSSEAYFAAVHDENRAQYLKMVEFVLSHFKRVSNSTSDQFAETFIKDKREFFQKFQHGLIFSTIHGADFFKNVYHCLVLGHPWSKKNEHGAEMLKGEYEDNFRKFIKLYLFC